MTEKDAGAPDTGKQNRLPVHGYYGAVHEDLDGEFNIREMVLFVRRRLGIILATIIVGTAVAGLYAYNKKPVYTAETLIKIEEENQILDLGTSAGGVVTSDASIQTEVNFIKSRMLTNELVEKIYRAEMARAFEDPITALPPSEPGLIDRSIEIAGALLPEEWFLSSGVAADSTQDPRAADLMLEAAEPGDDAEPDVHDGWLVGARGWVEDNWVVSDELVELASIPSPVQAVELVRERRIAEIDEALEVKQVGRAHVISVKYSDLNPRRSAQISNELVRLYIADQIREKRNQTGKATDFLEERLVELEDEVRVAELAIQQYIDENENIDPTVASFGGQQMQQLTNMVVDARATRKEREGRLRYIRELQGRDESLESLSEVLQSPYIANLWQQETDLQRRKVDLSIEYALKHPVILRIDAEIDDIKQRVNIEIERLVANLESELDGLRERESSIKADIDGLVENTSSVGRNEVELRRLEREASASRQIYENFLQRYKETREQQAIIEANARVIAEASVPRLPSSRDPGLVTLMGFALSSLIGLGAAFVREKLDNGVRSGKQLEAELGLPFLGLVPFLSSSKRKGKKIYLYLLDKPLSTYTETVRSLYTAIRMSNIDQPHKVVQLTSAVPQEGKTTLAVSLSVALTLDGQKVCLVDGDLRHPSVGAEIGRQEFDHDGCLVSYLTGETSLEDSTHVKMEGKLHVLPVLRNVANPAPLLGSQRMRDLIERLRSEFDYIIMDGPPVLGVSDSKTLVGLADTVLYVARWEKTTMDTATDAIRELEHCNANVVGCVMTQVDITRHAQYGYGGIDGYYKKYRKYYVD